MVTTMAQLDAPLAEALLWPAEQIDHFAWERPLPDNDAFGQPSWMKVVKEPVGVVGAILPWNYPFEIIIAKLGQALATGNTMVIKPAPDTPWSATRIGRLIAEQTDIPAGVVNIVPSSDHLIGEQLVTDPRVDMISFTGSTATGRRIMAAGAPTLKRLFLELGGKSADIILEDGDVATKMAFLGFMCMHAGQGCAMLTRTLIHQSRYDEAVELAKVVHGGCHLRRPHRPRRHPGTPGQRQAAGPGHGLHRQGCGRGRPPGHRRPPARPPREGLLRRADPLRRRGQLHDHRPGGDLRPGAGAHPLPGRRRRRPHRQRQRLRPVRRGDLGLRGAGPGRGLEDPVRARSAVNGGVYYSPMSPFGGYKASGIGRQNGIEGFEQYLETKTIAVGK